MEHNAGEVTATCKNMGGGRLSRRYQSENHLSMDGLGRISMCNENRITYI